MVRLSDKSGNRMKEAVVTESRQICVEVNQISFSYRKKPVLSDISFRAEEGECLAVVGANGRGKSTLLAILAGILKPKEGTTVCYGKVGYLPQSISLFEDMTVEDNLRFFAGLAKCEVPNELPFRLDDKRNERVGKLSGGQKRQVSIACALLGEPKVLLLDEPAAGLDVEYRESLLQLLKEKKEAGCTILYVGHEPLEVADICDKLLFLGETVAVYPREALAGETDDKLLFCKNYTELMKSKVILPV